MTIKQSHDDVFEYAILPATGAGEVIENGNTAQLLAMTNMRVSKRQ